MVLLALSGMLFVNLAESPGTFMVFTVVVGAAGLSLLLAAAVAHGIQLAREWWSRASSLGANARTITEDVSCLSVSGTINCALR